MESENFPLRETAGISHCNCEMCREYLIYYEKIKQNNPMWLTVSPPYNDKDPTAYYNDWLDDFEELLKCSKYILGVVEFANNRMHFHIMYSCDDKIKSYRLINRYRQNAVLKIYKGMPRKGLHYLFKDIEEAKELIPNQNVVFSDEHLVNRKRERKLKLKETRTISIFKERVQNIPEWMLKDPE